MMQRVSETEERKSRQYILDDLDLPGKVRSNRREESWSFPPLPFSPFPAQPPPLFPHRRNNPGYISHLSWTFIGKWGIRLLLISRRRGNKRLPEEGSWELRESVETGRHRGGKYCFDFISKTAKGGYQSWWHYSLVVLLPRRKETEVGSPWVWGLELGMTLVVDELESRISFLI